MASAGPPPTGMPQQGAPLPPGMHQQGALPPPMLAPPPQQGYNSNQPRSGGRGGGRGSQGGRGLWGGRGGGGGRGGRNGRGGGRGGGRGRGGNSQNASNNGPPMPKPANAVPYGFLPAYLPGASSLVEQLDRRLLVILRDGRHLVGTLSTFDQFSNMVMQETCERRILVVQKDKVEADSNNPGPDTICYQTDIDLGLFIVRGDNVVLLGEVDDDEEEQDEGQIRFVSLEEFEQLQEEEMKRKEESGEDDNDINWDFDMDLVA